MRLDPNTPIPTPEQMAPYIQAGHINVRTTGAVQVYNYSKRCIYDRAWNEVTCQARGLVYHADGRRLAVPLPKFFNHNEPDVELPSGPPDAVTVKYDGALGISFLHEGSIRWTTRGTLVSPQAAVANALWVRDHGHVEASYPTGWTLLAEIVHADTKVIAEHDFDGLVLLEARSIETGAYMPAERLDAVARALQMRRPAEGPADLEQLVRALTELPSSEEGWVARWGSHRVKFKGDAYMAVARLLQGLQPRRVGELWYLGTLADMLPALPEETRLQVEAEVADIEAAVVAYADRIAQWVDQVKDSTDREAAAEVRSRDPAMLSDVMRTRAGKPVDLRRSVHVHRFGKRPPEA